MQSLFMLLGGFGLMLMGVDGMSKALTKISGNKAKIVLQRLAGNRITAFFTGLTITGIVQSSTVTTVMVISFVHAELMSLTNAIAVMIGAQIGTTITAQLIAFDIGIFSLPMIAAGALCIFFSRNDRIQALGQALFGFGSLFYGFILMTTALHSYRTAAPLIASLEYLELHAFAAVFVGIISAAFLQSSSLTIGLLMAFASNGMLEASGALPLIIGINIGATAPGNLAAIGQSYIVKQAARAQTIMKIFGALAIVALFPLVRDFLHLIAQDPSRQIANAHTFFNIITALIALPLIGLLERLSPLFIFGKPDTRERLAYLDDASLQDASTALVQAQHALRHVMHHQARILGNIADMLILKRKHLALQYVHGMTSIAEGYEVKITEYLQKIAAQELSRQNSHLLDRTIRTLHEIGRMNEYAIKMHDIIAEKFQLSEHFPAPAKKDLRLLFRLTIEGLKKTDHLLKAPTKEDSVRVIANYDDVRRLRDSIRSKHQRYILQHSRSIMIMHHYIDILNALEEIAKKSKNIAEFHLPK